MSIYLITGATGNTGKPIVEGLLRAGHAVRIISRSKEKAESLVTLGALLFEGDPQDRNLLEKAMKGADAAYLMIPPNYGASDFTASQENYAAAYVSAIRSTGLRYAVTLSSIGAHLPEGAGVVQGLQKMESALNKIPGLNVLHLRPSYFMENIFGQIGIIKNLGIMGSPIRPDLKFPVVATRDIAAVALKRLLDLNFKSISHEYILGPEDLNYDEIASRLGKFIGNPQLKYVQFPYEDAAKGMMAAGMGESISYRMVEFASAMNDGRVMGDMVRSKENTTPTSLEDFGPIFAAVFNG
jgi:uncharacterized protein YbjT (DUF2867 family)